MNETRWGVRRRQTFWVTTVAAAIVALVACGQGNTATPVTPATVTPATSARTAPPTSVAVSVVTEVRTSVVYTAPAAVAPDSSAALSLDPSPVAVGQSESDDTGDADPTVSGPAVLPSSASGKQLGLGDVFGTTGQWTEDLFSIGDGPTVPGIATVVGGCGENYAAMLELRLAHHFAKLKMVVGQGNTSKSSDDLLVVQIYANGKQTDTRKIAFDTQDSFDIAVSDVNALKIYMFLDDDKCNDAGTTAVIQGLTVSG